MIFLVSCRNTPIPPDYLIPKSTIADTAMVVSAHPIFSEIGLDILQQGGDAVDAARVLGRKWFY